MTYDYHTHTNFSDGLLDPEELILLASKKKIKSISVTDHDSISNYSRVKEACEKYNIELIKGIEISSWYKGRDVHLLAYFEKEDDYLKLAVLEEKRKTERINRLYLICENLKSMDVIIDPDEMIDSENNHGIIGRPHVASLIIKKGYAKNQIEVFTKYLGNDKPGYVPTTYDSTLEMIKLVNDCNGLPVIAHPGNFFIDNPDELLVLIEAGLQGIECFHHSHNSSKVDEYLKLAKIHNLIVTGGSDFHGIRHRKKDKLRHIPLTEEQYITFKKRLYLCSEKNSIKTV